MEENKTTLNEVVRRVKAPTPKIFKQIRNIGLIVTGIGTAVATAPVALPAMIVTVAGYLITVGSVAAAVSQVAEKK